MQIHLKILYSNFLFVHYEAQFGMWLNNIKIALQAEICVAKCLNCGQICSMIQLNLHPVHTWYPKYTFVKRVMVCNLKLVNLYEPLNQNNKTKGKGSVSVCKQLNVVRNFYCNLSCAFVIKLKTELKKPYRSFITHTFQCKALKNMNQTNLLSIWNLWNPEKFNL